MGGAALELGRIFLGAVFLAAGVAKLLDRAEFERNLPALAGRVFARPRVTRTVGRALPCLEVSIGSLLIVGILGHAAAVAGAGLLLAFTVAVAWAVARHASVSCGCFGNIGHGRVTWATLGRNVGLLGLAAAVAWWEWFGPIASAGALGGRGQTLGAFTLGTSLAVGLLLLAQYLGVRSRFLPLPASPYRSGIRWTYVAPSAGGGVGWHGADWRSRVGLFGRR